MGHIQATGVDAAGRKQYLYHPKWREQRDRAEVRRHDRVRPRPARSCAQRGARSSRPRTTSSRERVLACARAAARPRLLPDRLRGLRRHQRDLRPRDDAQGARHARRRRHDGLRLPRQVAASGASRASSTRCSFEVVARAQAPPRRRRRAARLQGGRPLARRALARHQRLHQGADGRRPLGQGLPHLERDAARRRRARRQRRGGGHQDRAQARRSRGRSRRSRTTSATRRRSAARPTSTRA